MPARLGKVALPGNDLVWSAALTSSASTADLDYLVGNLQQRDPAKVHKASGNATTVRAVHAGTRTPVAVFLFNTNATAASITNPAGLNQAIPLPSRDLDGQRRHAWLDLDGLANVTDDEHSLVLSTTDPILFIGRIALVTELNDVNYSATNPPRIGRTRPGNTVVRTRLGSLVVNDAGIRTRWAEFSIELEEDRALWENLDASAKGAMVPFPYVPFADTNDAWWVTLPDDFSTRLRLPMTEIPIRLEELSSGPANG